MTTNYGGGVSRVLDPAGRAFLDVIWQQGKPPCDADLNLMADLANDWQRLHALRGTPSGFLGNETNLAADFQTSAAWSNWFRFGRQRVGETQSILWAVVNGWVLPVAGTRTGTPPGAPNDSDTTNIIALDPPPTNSGDFRTDFVFLEAWVARIPPNPATTNKPAAASIWRYGNVEGGFSFLPDDLLDPAIGFETTQRTQLQYRVRVAKGLVGLTSNPDGFDPAVVKAQGAAAAPTSFVFQNMRSALGDPGLWRAGDGTANALGTVDGYTYAIPIGAVFRRNGVVWSGDPSQNLNGAFNRNPTSVDRTGILTFSTTPTLGSALTAAATTLTLVSATNTPLPASPASPVLIKIGDELLTYTAITGLTLTGLTRGVNGTRAEAHALGTTVFIMSGRPDGLFADQIAGTDVLDLRHVVNPNGFDYDALLRGNLDKLVRGQLRANWKRSGAGPQGPFVSYQDKIASVGSSTALGVTHLDGADDVRLIFSDAAVTQPVELIVKANSAATPSPSGVGWDLSLTVTHGPPRAVANAFSVSDVITIPVAQFKSGLPGGDADQVRFVNDSVVDAVVVRIDGQADPLPASAYTVTPANPGPSDDLVITLGGSFPGPVTNQLYITVHLMYGAGRGLSRRPDSIHSVSYISPNADILLQQSGIPATNLPTRISWAPLWSKFRNAMYKNALPSTAESYGDLGSKTVILQPFRRIQWPTEFRTIDGTSVNVAPTSFVSGTAGVGAASTTFTDATKNFSAAGVLVNDVLVVASGPAAGSYIVTVVAPGADVTKLTLLTSMPVATGIVYTISHAQGLMPLLKPDATTSKWGTTDPLGLFSGTTDPGGSTNNLFVTLPRHLVPGWGEVRCPILWQDAASTLFAEGINFMCLTLKGSPFVDGDKNYVPYANGGLTYAAFTTLDFNPPGTNPAAYNTQVTFSGTIYAGMRLFTDARGLGRQGLELPPFYGVSRLFAVYEANDYKANGSAYNPSTRVPTGAGAKNLLRQDFQGPTFWIELDADGDSTFILNADTLDLTKSTLNPISSFAAGNYVIEANIFGFDRGSFDLTQDFRLVLTRVTGSSQMRGQANSGTRATNVGTVIAGPTSVLPGPATSTDQVVVNYSRTPYQGDAFGSQTNYADIGYAPGSLTSGIAFQLTSTNLNQSTLTRPNQKPLEVLASVGFATTLGTGRLSGDTLDPGAPPANVFDFRNVGYEDPSVYPPATSISARPVVLMDSAASGEATVIETGTSYLGCTERLPLGALWRDKDFRGGSVGLGDGTQAPFVYLGNASVDAFPAGLAATSSYEQSEAILDTASVASGAPGDVVVHVDGEQGNYSLLVNFRTNRGGSLFTASGAHPGGEVATAQGQVTAPASHTNLVVGRAYLVRNAPTTIGLTEVSAGDELMMLVVTNVEQLKTGSSTSAYVRVGTNGTREGYAAADLYRVEGHPLVKNNVHYSVDPSTIVLSPKVP